MKTLVVTLKDLGGLPHGTETHQQVTVTAVYTSEVILTDGTIIPRVVSAPKPLSQNGRATFQVYESESTEVKPDYRGFAVRVVATFTPTRGQRAVQQAQRTVKVLTAGGDTVQLGDLPAAEPVPREWTTVGEILEDVDQAVATIDNLAATATTLPPGSPATATVTGPMGAKVVNFSIPRGADGAPGMGYEEGQQLLAQNQTTLDAAQAAQADAAQAATDAQTAVDGMNAVGSLRDSTTPGLLDYTLGADGPDPEPPPVTILSDNFNRTAADLVGTTPQTGAAWTGTAARWSANGTTASASGAGALLSDIGRLDTTVTTVLSLVTTGTGASQLARIYLGANGTAVTAGVWAALTINGSGDVTAALWKTIGGTSTNLGAAPVTATANTATPQTVTVTLTISGTTVTLDCGAGPMTVELTSADVAALSTRAGLYAATAIPGITVDSITATRPGDPIVPEPSGQIVTATPGGSLPTVILEALDSRYTGGGSSASALEPLRTLRDFGAGQVTAAVVSDSTANDRNDWLRIFTQKWGSTLPSRVRRTYRDWDATSSTWRTELVDNEGTPPDTGVIVDDDFSTVGEVVGSTPNAGPVWAGSADGWTSDGDLATLTGGASKTLSNNLGSKDQTVRATLSMISTGMAATQSLRVYAGSVSSGLYTGLWAALGISTTGNVTVALYTTFGASTTTLAGSTPVAGAVTNSATPQDVTIEVTTRIQQAKVTVTAAGQTTTLTGTIAEADVPTLGNHGGFVGAPAGVTDYGLRLTSVRMDTPAADNPVDPPTLAVHNAAIAGGGLTTHFGPAALASMFGALDVDVLILAMGHNSGTQTPAAFTTEVGAWLDAWKAEHPGSAVLISSQNPQVAPSTGVVAHRDRQAALRTWAKARGFDYVPVFEAFTAQPDGGASLIGSDGVHPTTPPSGTTGDYGSVLWADTAVAALEN